MFISMSNAISQKNFFCARFFYIDDLIANKFKLSLLKDTLLLHSLHIRFLTCKKQYFHNHTC